MKSGNFMVKSSKKSWRKFSLKERRKYFKGVKTESLHPDVSKFRFNGKVYEYNFKDLKKDVTDYPGLKDRVRTQDLRVSYLGIDKKGVIHFRTKSGTTPGLSWHQRIKLMDLQKAVDLQVEDDTIKNKDVVNMAVFGDLKMYCDDPSFIYYGWQYMNWHLDSGLEPEVRPPKIRNP